MKPYLYLIISFVFASYASSQNITKIAMDSSLKTNYLFKTFHHDNYCIFPRYDDGDTVRSFIETHGQYFQFYLSEINDTLLIFDGKLCGGHEGGVVNVYKFIDGEPETVMSRPGKVARIQNEKIWVYTYPCCAQVINLITPFSFITGEQLGETSVFYDRDDYSNIFPIKESPNQNYELSKDSEIHWSPFKNEESHAPVCGSWKNIIGNFAKGTSFTLIEVSSNDWALIRLDNMVTSEGYCLGEYYTKLIGFEEYVLYGWVPLGNIDWK